MNKIIIIHLKKEKIIFLAVVFIHFFIVSFRFFYLVHSHKTDGKLERRLDFFHKPRFDSLKSISMTKEYIKEMYEKRDDL